MKITKLFKSGSLFYRQLKRIFPNYHSCCCYYFHPNCNVLLEYLSCCLWMCFVFQINFLITWLLQLHCWISFVFARGVSAIASCVDSSYNQMENVACKQIWSLLKWRKRQRIQKKNYSSFETKCSRGIVSKELSMDKRQ